jgi:peptide/nickel transport system permease protein
MLKLILNRVLVAIPTLFIVSLFVFALQHALPGDPFLVIAGEERDPEIIARLREIYRMNDPIIVQYFAWLGQVLQGEFGRSLRTGEPVLGLILQKLPVTIQLATAAMIVALAIGLPAGIIAAIRKGTMVDYTASAVALSGLSIPNFWLGIVMILVFAVELRWLPASGYVPFFSDPLGALETLAMPAIVLGTGLAAFIMRHTRSAMLEVLRSDYVRECRDQQACAAQRPHSGDHPLDHPVRRVAGRRRADRTGLYHSRLRQADRGRRVQPRLRCRAGRCPLHRHWLHRHEPCRRHAVYSRQSTAQGALMTTIATTPAADLLPPPESRSWGKLKRSRSAWIGGSIVTVFVLMAILAPLIAPFDPNKTNFLLIRKPPSAIYWLGTDEIGRDILSRLLYGAQASLMAGVVSVLIAVAIGVPLGLASGWYGGWFDMVVSRVTDALLACPFLILAIAFAAILGPSLTNAMIAIGLSAVPIFIRLARGQAISVKAEDYIEGARAVGVKDARILIAHLAPNTLPPILVQCSLFMAQAIILEASLSFLGLGQQPPQASWGSMLNTAKNFMEQAPWMSISPGIAICLVVIGFNILGDGLRDALDPKES